MANDAAREGSLLSAVGGIAEGAEADVRQVFELLRSGIKTILAVIAVALTIGILYCLVADPVYEADGLLQVEQNSSKSGLSSQLSEISTLLEGAPLETQAEIQVLGSRMVLGEVIDKLNLLVRATPKYLPIVGAAVARTNNAKQQPVEVPSFLRQYAWGGEEISVSTWDVPDDYLDRPLILKKTIQGFTVKLGHGRSLLGKPGESATLDSPDGRFTIFVKQLTANPGTEFELVKLSEQAALTELGKKLAVTEKGKQTGIIALRFEGGSPDFAAAVIDNVEGAYLRKDVERRSATAQQSLVFLQEQLPKLKGQVEAAQAQFKAYQSSHQSVDVSEETSLVLKQSVDLETQRLKLEQQREESLQRFTAEHPVVKALDQQIASLEGAQNKVRQQTGKLPSTQQEILSLKRDLDVSTELYTQMLNSIQQLQVAKAGTIGNVRIVDFALKTDTPIKPRTLLAMAMSIVAGLVIGVVVVFIQRAFLRGIEDPTILESRFGLPTYAMIPFSQNQKRLNRVLASKISTISGENHILAALDSEDIAIEALRSLRTSLHFALLEANNNVIMLTGPAPGLGKSFVTVNLGAVLAMADKQVVVVDADLRRGHLNRYVGAPPSPGLSDYVAGNADLATVTHDTATKGLDIIFRGTVPPNPSELLLHERFTELIQILSSKYDYVLVDTPPVLAVTDPSIVGRLAGCSLIVLKSAEHPLREIEETLKRLASAGVKVKGSLFNQVGAMPGSYGYGSYGYSYNYGYRSEHGEKA